MGLDANTQRLVTIDFPNNVVEVPITLSPTATEPCYAHETDAGLDLCCDVDVLTLYPFCRAKVPTGVAFELPPGHFGDIRSKSGLAVKHGITVLTGTIDAGYRGEVHVVLINNGSETVTFHRGDKVAQLVIVPYARAHLGVSPRLSESDRGENGFGSTGK